MPVQNIKNINIWKNYKKTENLNRQFICTILSLNKTRTTIHIIVVIVDFAFCKVLFYVKNSLMLGESLLEE